MADALAPQGREGGAARWGKLKPGHLEAREICGAAAGRNVTETYWEVYWHPPKSVDDSYPLISVTFAPMVHTSSHIPGHSIIPQGHGHTGAPFLSPCHVVSLLLCNFFPPLSLFPEENVSPVASTVSVRGLNNLFHVWLMFRVSVVPGGFQEFQPLHPQQWRHLRECRRHHNQTLPEFAFHLEGTGMDVSCEDEKQGRQTSCRWSSEQIIVQNSRAKQMHAGDWKSDDDREDEGVRECKRGKEREPEWEEWRE